MPRALERVVTCLHSSHVRGDLRDAVRARPLTENWPEELSRRYGDTQPASLLTIEGSMPRTGFRTFLANSTNQPNSSFTVHPTHLLEEQISGKERWRMRVQSEAAAASVFGTTHRVLCAASPPRKITVHVGGDAHWDLTREAFRAMWGLSWRDVLPATQCAAAVSALADFSCPLENTLHDMSCAAQMRKRG